MNHTRPYPRLHIDTAPSNATGTAGGVLLTETIQATGLHTHLSRALRPWKKPFAVHDPGKIVLDMALTLAVGGDCLADIATLRAEPSVYGRVASDPTVSRLLKTLGRDPRQALAAINSARQLTRKQAWALAGAHAPDSGATAASPVIIDMDATLVTAHSEKHQAAPTFKKGFGFHPLLAMIDHGDGGTGEIVAEILRPGNAGSNTARDHVDVLTQALRQLPGQKTRPGKSVLVRADSAGGTKRFLEHVTRVRMGYSVGFTLPTQTPELYEALTKEDVWEAAYDRGGELRTGADVAELTGLLDLGGWPAGMRVIVRRERPHPGAQLRFDDVDGYRLTGFATNTRGMQLADLELRHRARARCEDRIRVAKDSGLRNFPLKDFGTNQVWLAIVALASELEAFKSMLAFPGTRVRVWEPKRLRHRLYSIPATIARTGRRVVLHVKETAPWAGVVVDGVRRLRGLPVPAG